jgi:hypothetical protein
MDPYVKLLMGTAFNISKTHQNGGRHPSWVDELKFHVNNETEIIV